MHPNTVRFIEAFDHEAALSGTYRSKLDKGALVFLEQVLRSQASKHRIMAYILTSYM